MAKKTITTVELTDDLNGGKADQTIAFGFDGVSYEIDLSRKNARDFERAVRPYVGAARKVRHSRGRGPAAVKSGKRTDLGARVGEAKRSRGQ